jgi:hypothetical protein
LRSGGPKALYKQLKPVFCCSAIEAHVLHSSMWLYGSNAGALSASIFTCRLLSLGGMSFRLSCQNPLYRSILSSVVSRCRCRKLRERIECEQIDSPGQKHTTRRGRTLPNSPNVACGWTRHVHHMLVKAGIQPSVGWIPALVSYGSSMEPGLCGSQLHGRMAPVRCSPVTDNSSTDGGHFS